VLHKRQNIDVVMESITQQSVIATVFFNEMAISQPTYVGHVDVAPVYAGLNFLERRNLYVVLVIS